MRSPTPGFRAAILSGNSQRGPFRSDSSPEEVGAATTFTLRGSSARYYVVWITRLPAGGKAEVSEVSATR